MCGCAAPARGRRRAGAAPHAAGYVVLVRSPGGLVQRREVGPGARRVVVSRLFERGRVRVGIAARNPLDGRAARPVVVSR